MVRDRFGLSRFILNKPKMILSSPSLKAGKCAVVLCFQEANYDQNGRCFASISASVRCKVLINKDMQGI